MNRKKQDSNNQPVMLLKSAFNTLISHPQILFPFAIVAFLQVLLLEIIFFAPREPLKAFFEQIILRTEGEMFLHYPFNFILLTKWFQNPWIQVPLYIFISSFCIAAAVLIIDHINREKDIEIGKIFRETLSSYVHIVSYALLTIVVMMGLSQVHLLALKRAAAIRSDAGFFFILKKVVILSAPYMNLLTAVLVTVLFAFVIPLIVIEKKKIVAAVIENFKLVWKSFWLVFIVLLLPAILYVPVLLIKSNKAIFDSFPVPEVWIGIVLFSILITICIDAIQYTAITVYYLLKKEEK